MADFEKVYKIKFDTSQAQGALKKLNQSVVKVGKSAEKDVGGRGKRALEKLAAAAKRANTQFKKIRGNMENIGKKMTTRVTLPIVAAGTAMIKFTSDYEEAINKVDVSFGNASQSVKDFAKTTLKQFGIAEGSALDMAALFGDMGTSMGLTREEAADMSTQLVGLSGDLASFKNLRLDEVQTALSGIFTGETESLKRLGFVQTIQNLEEFAKDRGITKNIKDMTQAEKVMLRYNFIMEKASNAQGDFQRTSGGAANQMRIFTEGTKQLAQSFGKHLLPWFTRIVKKLNEWIDRFGALDDDSKKLILTLGGIAAAIGPITFALSKLATPLGIITAGFAAWGVAIKTIADNWVFLKNAFSDMWEDFTGWVGESFGSAFSGVGATPAPTRRPALTPAMETSGGGGNSYTSYGGNTYHIGTTVSKDALVPMLRQHDRERERKQSAQLKQERSREEAPER